jgi:hypothetical protein
LQNLETNLNQVTHAELRNRLINRIPAGCEGYEILVEDTHQEFPGHGVLAAKKFTFVRTTGGVIGETFKAFALQLIWPGSDSYYREEDTDNSHRLTSGNRICEQLLANPRGPFPWEDPQMLLAQQAEERAAIADKITLYFRTCRKIEIIVSNDCLRATAPIGDYPLHITIMRTAADTLRTVIRLGAQATGILALAGSATWVAQNVSTLAQSIFAFLRSFF